MGAALVEQLESFFVVGRGLLIVLRVRRHGYSDVCVCESEVAVFAGGCGVRQGVLEVIDVWNQEVRGEV